jgi:hypothetical protein
MTTDCWTSTSPVPEPDPKESTAPNLRFINNGNGTFTEAAQKYGIADTGLATRGPSQPSPR